MTDTNIARNGHQLTVVAWAAPHILSLSERSEEGLPIRCVYPLLGVESARPIFEPTVHPTKTGVEYNSMLNQNSRERKATERYEVARMEAEAKAQATTRCYADHGTQLQAGAETSRGTPVEPAIVWGVYHSRGAH